MAVNSCDEGQDAYSISVLPGEGSTNIPCESQLDFSSLSEISNPSKSETYLDPKMTSQNYVKNMENTDAYSGCFADADIENGISVILKTKDESIEKLKTESPLTRQFNLQIGEKFMQILMNHSVMLHKFISKDKSATERFHETPTHRSRKYKRSASFNSRRVVLLFSVMSSMGTMLLIYLTLRVRQIGDELVHV